MQKPANLSVNLNKVALVRNARPLDIPHIESIAQQCINAGAHGITVHPRPDERHIRISDVERIAALLVNDPQTEFNIEGNPFTGLMEIVRKIHPTQCTLVPDSPEQSTSDHGWEASDATRLGPVIDELRELGIRVSLFMNPEPQAIADLAALKPDRIELYTEPYAQAYARGQYAAILEQYASAAQCAREFKIGVNAGHDLNLDNLPPLLERIEVLECSIGHALTADALTFGMNAAVKKYLQKMGWPLTATS